MDKNELCKKVSAKNSLCKDINIDIKKAIKKDT